MCQDCFYIDTQKRALICIFFCLLVFSSFAQTKEPRTAHDYFELGEELLQQGKIAECIVVYNDCLRLDPHFADAYYSRGLAREQVNQNEEALIDYSIFLELRPDHYEAVLNRAVLRYTLKQYPFAKEDFQRLLLLPKQETSTIYYRQQALGGGVDQIFSTQSSGKGYLFNWLGLTETQLKNYSSALIHFDSALKLNPREADFFVNRGIAHQQNREVKKAQHDFEKAVELNPHHAEAKYNLSMVSASNLKKVALLDSALSDNASIHYLYSERAYGKMLQGDYTGALLDYNEAIHLNATEPAYFLNRGFVQEKLHRYAAAYEDYTRAFRLDERFEKAWLNRGNVLMRQRHYYKAVEDYTSALLFNEQYTAAYYNRALAYQKLHELDRACHDIRMAEKIGMQIPPHLKAQMCIQ